MRNPIGALAVVLLVFVGLTPLARAQASSVNVAVIDLARVVAKSDLCRDVAARQESLYSALDDTNALGRERLRQAYSEVDRLQRTLLENRERLSPEDNDALERKLREEAYAIDNALEQCERTEAEARSRIEHELRQLTSAARRRLAQHCETFRRKRGLSVLYEAQACLSVDDTLDMTDEFIAFLNRDCVSHESSSAAPARIIHDAGRRDGNDAHHSAGDETPTRHVR